MKHATVYKRHNIVLFDAMSETTEGVWISCAPMVRLDGASSEHVLGETLLNVLGASTIGVPHPNQDDWKSLEVEWLIHAGVKTYSAFARGTVACGVDQHEGTIEFTPERNKGAKGGFVPILDRVSAIPSTSSPQDIGAALVKALQSCDV